MTAAASLEQTGKQILVGTDRETLEVLEKRFLGKKQEDSRLWTTQFTVLFCFFYYSY